MRSRKSSWGMAQSCAVALLAPLAVLALLAMSGGAGDRDPLALVQRSLVASDLAWVVLDRRDSAVFVTGAASDVETRRFGFDEAAGRIRSALSEANEARTLVIDATTIADAPDSPTGPGAPLLALGEFPSPEACAAALAGSAAQRGFEFTPREATLDASHQMMLDALAAGAIACRAHVIAIGVHTDSSGAAAANQALSVARAEHIVERLVGAGAPAEALRAVGYGESRLLVKARTPSADAQNRRVEISVAQRS